MDSAARTTSVQPDEPTVATSARAWRPSLTAPLSENGTVPLPASAVLALAELPRVPRTGLVRGPGLGERTRRIAAFPFRGRRHALPGDIRKAQALLTRVRPGAVLVPTTAGLVVRHPAGVTAVLRSKRVSADRLPNPVELLSCGPNVAAQALFHCFPGQPPRAWLTVHSGLSGSDDPERVHHHTLNQARARLDGAETTAETDPATLTALAHVTGGYLETRETWRFWRAGAVTQACFRVEGTPHPHLVATLLTRAPGVAVTVAWNAHPRGQGIVVRLAATTDSAVDSAAHTLACLVAPLRLVRLDGAHVAGLAATLPIGHLSR
ncbi:hypothetical protein [Actinokineospora iranica]|uniref:Uncharacterized protein n=1 Tax=Actinokineospora iranica TaxID=1271860 RepID=A0A1G6XPZ7_9PSEU|nr:hypothetical protein [Actinokineospora iranica]SDD80299.1 hypothetical protein SAMN05216174_11868 [Actinokineospora iranica]